MDEGMRPEGARDALVREQLVDRRRRLQSAVAEVERAQPLLALLGEVDAALARLDAGTYGLCEACQGPIEEDRLRADPLLRYCVDDLTPRERQALQQDLDLARRVQTDLLPRTPLVHAGWEAHHRYEPVGPAGGDCCDLVIEGDDLYFLLGDVAGKGLAASMLMSHLQAIFRSLVALRPSVSELLERMNRLYCQSTGGSRYATLVCGRARPAGEVELANAGHCPALWLRGDQAVTLPPDGLPVGLFGSSPYGLREMRLSSGESLLLYTDGASETTDTDGLEYGTEGLRKAALVGRERAGGEVLKACLQGLAAFRGDAPRQDDLTLLVLGRV